MREILFRGKAVDGISINGVENAWVYGDLIHYAEDEAYIMDNNCKCWDVTHDGTRVIPETVGQYIGIKTTDNNTKLFDGDFVSILELFADGTMEDCHSGVIEFRNGQFVIDEIPISEYTEEHDILLIGNTHDNPKLLEGEK